MDARRWTALGALGLVGALVIALAATDGDDGSPLAAPPPPSSNATPGTVGTAGTTDGPPTTAATGASEAPTTPATPETAPPTTVDPLVPDLEPRGVHPPLLEIDGWLQSEIESLEELRGKVVAVQFWTFGCHNCRATLPHLQALYEKYPREDFEIVGVHAPEFDRERDPERIAAAAADLGVTWPIALDTEKRSFRSWQTERRFWPRLYLLDRDGEIRYDKIGEGKYDVIDAAVGALIAEEPS